MSRTFTAKERQREIDMYADQDKWPMWPFLCVKRYQEDKDMEVGLFLVDGREVLKVVCPPS